LKIIKLITKDKFEQQLYNNLKKHQLPDYLLYINYDNTASWLNLDKSKDFPIASNLTTMLTKNIQDILKVTGQISGLASIGVGSGEKERIILQELCKKGLHLHYCAIDVNPKMTSEAIRKVSYLELDSIGVIGMIEELDKISPYWKSPAIIALLGNTFCNYNPYYITSTISNNINSNDYFLVDFHLFSNINKVQSKRIIEQIYSTERNVLFNMSPLLKRGGHRENFKFNLNLITENIKNEKVYRTRKYLEIVQPCTITTIAGDINLNQGEKIELGFTYKYTKQQALGFLKKGGFELLKVSYKNDNLLVICKKS
jgi:uncharacterized SAM-dependent methyltransferase